MKTEIKNIKILQSNVISLILNTETDALVLDKNIYNTHTLAENEKLVDGHLFMELTTEYNAESGNWYAKIDSMYFKVINGNTYYINKYRPVE